MKLIHKIIAAITAAIGVIATACSAIFCIKAQKKIDNLEKENQARIQEEKEKLQKVQEAYAKELKENEELKNKALNGNTDDNDAALNELLHNAAQKGKQRNNTRNL